VLQLRRDHRILGSLVGADARFPREMMDFHFFFQNRRCTSL